ncbi:hypothetical protein [Streptomyces sp. 058-1L]|uniref:hypothetical protein n=1 Tax=Streptomyces sp. 058-1L TaxID=2789266 RepID=UPI00397EB197
MARLRRPVPTGGQDPPGAAVRQDPPVAEARPGGATRSPVDAEGPRSRRTAHLDLADAQGLPVRRIRADEGVRPDLAGEAACQGPSDPLALQGPADEAARRERRGAAVRRGPVGEEGRPDLAGQGVRPNPVGERVRPDLAEEAVCPDPMGPRVEAGRPCLPAFREAFLPAPEDA